MGIDAVGDRDEVAGVDHDMGGPAAGLGDRGDAPSDEPRVGVGTDRGHDADQVVAEHEREPGLTGVAAAAHPLFGERHAGGEHLDERLAVAGGGQGSPLDDEPVRLDESGEHDRGDGGVGTGEGGVGCGDGARSHGEGLSAKWICVIDL